MVCAPPPRRPQGRDRVGDAKAEVLVAVDLHRLLQPIDHLRNHDRDRLGRRDAHGVGNRQRVHVAFGGDLRHDVQEPVELGAGRIDGEEHRVEAASFAASVVSMDDFIARSNDQP